MLTRLFYRRISRLSYNFTAVLTHAYKASFVLHLSTYLHRESEMSSVRRTHIIHHHRSGPVSSNPKSPVPFRAALVSQLLVAHLVETNMTA